MRRSPEVEKRVRESADAMMRGDLDTIRALTSKEQGVVMIGSDPDEWWHGHDEVIAALQSDSESGLSAEIVDIEAYEEGDVAWATMRAVFIDDEGRVPFRATTVYRREDGEWRTVQGHASIGVPNEQMHHPALHKATQSA